jgi:hypothetical protein
MISGMVFPSSFASRLRHQLHIEAIDLAAILARAERNAFADRLELFAKSCGAEW